MKSHPKFHIIAIVCMFALAACNGLVAPTATPKPSSTHIPTNTFTPQPTSTLTPTAQPTLALGERQKVNAGGYSLQVPIDFETKIRNTQATVSNKDQTILISIAVAPRKDDTQTVETVLNSFIANVKKDVKDLNTGDLHPAKVGKLDGMAIDLSGTMFNTKNTGQAIAADTGQPGFFIAFAFVADGAGEKLWDTQGHQVFDAIINSVEFFTPIVETGSCTIATDKTYGYTKENPIKVGGGDFDGPPREREYLDNLAGPKGEKISYSRSGSLNFGDTILDAYVITGLSKEVTLYIDEYSFTEPQAPVGFTCLAAFTLEKP